MPAPTIVFQIRSGFAARIALSAEPNSVWSSGKKRFSTTVAPCSSASFLTIAL